MRGFWLLHLWHLIPAQIGWVLKKYCDLYVWVRLLPTTYDWYTPFCSQNKVARKQGGDNQLTPFSLVRNHCAPVYFNPSLEMGIKRSGIILEYLHQIGLPYNTPSSRLSGIDSQADKRAEHGRECLLCSVLCANWVAEIKEPETKYHCYSLAWKSWLSQKERLIQHNQKTNRIRKAHTAGTDVHSARYTQDGICTHSQEYPSLTYDNIKQST